MKELNKVKEGGCSKQIRVSGMPLKKPMEEERRSEHWEGGLTNKTHRKGMPQINYTKGDAQSQQKLKKTSRNGVKLNKLLDGDALIH